MHTEIRNRRRSTLSTLLVGGAAVVAVAGLTSAPAQAAPAGPWIAMVFSANDRALGGGTGLTQEEAIASAMVGCRDVNLGAACEVIGTANADAGIPCMSVAVSAPGSWSVGFGNNVQESDADALNIFASGTVIGSGCASPTEATPGPGTATVINDVDAYEVPDGIGTPYPGVFLDAGDSFTLVEPCRDNWCHLVTPGIGDGTSWVYQDGFLDVS